MKPHQQEGECISFPSLSNDHREQTMYLPRQAMKILIQAQEHRKLSTKESNTPGENDA